MIYLLSELIDDEGGFVKIFRAIWDFGLNVVRSSQLFWDFMNMPVRTELKIPVPNVFIIKEAAQLINIILGEGWLPNVTYIQLFGMGLPVVILMGLYIFKTFVPLA